MVNTGVYFPSFHRPLQIRRGQGSKEVFGVSFCFLPSDLEACLFGGQEESRL